MMVKGIQSTKIMKVNSQNQHRFTDLDSQTQPGARTMIVKPNPGPMIMIVTPNTCTRTDRTTGLQGL